ncbi:MULTISPECIES: GtrA family protein [unclassified Mesorhizobium]|uniref:GtrA family protein n=1 Tax=unclassified Mesorhizobium TaxID=325217 RepID=UPI001126DBF9|nr:MULTISPECIES: GtrA family protein [unclassified Mesorhizobium]TPN43030.1 GtrA family protein [Mesorhizobium sp. B1-1-9]TPN52369.1 GtrA family protein [Mesorhizobium sp. B1-1-7]
MTPADTTISVKAAQPASRRNDLAVALIATLAMVAVNALGGFPGLTDTGGDNDSLLRLVEVRDMLAGQGWFDLHQYRMGVEGGFVMHWSRLVDAPLAAIILVASALTGSMAMAETVAEVLWPALLFCLALLFTVRAARSFAGAGAVLPAAVIGAAALHFIGIFSPGALDHHNVQLTLTMASLSLLLEAPVRRWAALLAGLCAALTLAVGMETAPYVATIGVCVSLLFVADPSGERRIARDFGLGFAGVSALVFLTTIAPSAWGQPQCDAFSTVQFVVAALAGCGLAAAASLDMANSTLGRRLMALGLLALVLAAVMVFLFPQCLATPYAEIDPRLSQIWLGHIEEAQSIIQLVLDDPAMVVTRFATPLVAIVLMALHFSHGGWRRQDSLVGALLVVAVLVSAWEVRGSTFSIALAVIPLCAWIAKWRQRAEASPSRNSVLRMAAAWLISVNAVWSGAAGAASGAFETGAAAKDAGSDALCHGKASFAALGRMPATTVLSISNLGSPILAFTGHRALASLYHRNVAGNVLALDALLGSAAEAKAILQSRHVGLVALCRGNPESRLFAATAPDGFLAGLMRGGVPGWLEPVAETRGAPLELYRVRPTG